MPVPDSQHDDVTTCAALSNDGNILVSGSAAGTVRVWNVARDRRALVLLVHHADLHGHIDTVTALRWASAGTPVASWAARTLTALSCAGLSLRDASVCTEFSILASGGGGLDCTCIVWDLNTGAPIRSLPRMPGPHVAIAISPTTVRARGVNHAVTPPLGNAGH